MSEEIEDWFRELGPERRPCVLFVGRAGGRFIDNCKYAYIHFTRHEPEIDSYFVTGIETEHAALQAHGFSPLLFGSPQAQEVFAQADLVICDDFSWRIDNPAGEPLEQLPAIQLWHGVPLKLIGIPEIASNRAQDEAFNAMLSSAYSGWAAVASTSAFATQYCYARAFQADDFPLLGYPRNDALSTDPTPDTLINVDLALLQELQELRSAGGKAVFYLPTFRDQSVNPFPDGAFDVEAVAELAAAHNAIVVIKLHPYLELGEHELPANVRVASPQSDVYPLLHECDVLLTDYSSVYFDFLLLDRPMVFYSFDLDEYVASCREMFFDYEPMTPGPKATDMTQLCTALEISLQGEDNYGERRQAIRDLMFAYQDADSSARLASYAWERFLL